MVVVRPENSTSVYDSKMVVVYPEKSSSDTRTIVVRPAPARGLTGAAPAKIAIPKMALPAARPPSLYQTSPAVPARRSPTEPLEPETMTGREITPAGEVVKSHPHNVESRIESGIDLMRSIVNPVNTKEVTRMMPSSGAAESTPKLWSVPKDVRTEAIELRRAPKFHSGGRVPGAEGSEQLIVAQGGERVQSISEAKQQTHSVGGRGSITIENLQVSFDELNILGTKLKKRIEEEFEKRSGFGLNTSSNQFSSYG
jgi:hypothetical protein